jgi:hypothetical protein
MSVDLIELVAQRFRAFAEPYLSEPGDGFAYRLKIEHTARVEALAATIGSASALPGHIQLAARIAALLHDVGRFPQYKQYRTFRDSESANHAALSVRHALREHMLAGVPKDIKRLALGAVFLHNVRSLPPSLPADTMTVARILRDSDKLDIFRVMIAHFSQENPEHPEVALDVKPHPTAYSQDVLTQLQNGKTGDYRHIVWVNDFKLMAVGWIYDMNFRHSCQILQDLGHLDTIFESLPKDPPLLSLRSLINAHLASRLAGA